MALQRDIELFIISKVSLRMPVNLTDQGLGMQYVVVKRSGQCAQQETSQRNCK